MTAPPASWRTLWRDPPGRRFQNRYERTRNYGPLRRALVLAGGGALVVAGIVLMPLPGPGILVAIVGGAVMAGQSRRMAQALDKAELRVRRWLGRG